MTVTIDIPGAWHHGMLGELLADDGEISRVRFAEHGTVAAPSVLVVPAPIGDAAADYEDADVCHPIGSFCRECRKELHMDSELESGPCGGSTHVAITY